MSIPVFTGNGINMPRLGFGTSRIGDTSDMEAYEIGRAHV